MSSVQAVLTKHFLPCSLVPLDPKRDAYQQCVARFVSALADFKESEQLQLLPWLFELHPHQRLAVHERLRELGSSLNLCSTPHYDLELRMTILLALLSAINALSPEFSAAAKAIVNLPYITAYTPTLELHNRVISSAKVFVSAEAKRDREQVQFDPENAVSDLADSLPPEPEKKAAIVERVTSLTEELETKKLELEVANERLALLELMSRLALEAPAAVSSLPKAFELAAAIEDTLKYWTLPVWFESKLLSDFSCKLTITESSHPDLVNELQLKRAPKGTDILFPARSSVANPASQSRILEATLGEFFVCSTRELLLLGSLPK